MVNVGCDNVCCSSLVLSITAGSGRFPAVNSQRIYVPFGLVNSKKKKKKKRWAPGNVSEDRARVLFMTPPGARTLKKEKSYGTTGGNTTRRLDTRTFITKTGKEDERKAMSTAQEDQATS